jgi:hypothetical protein
MGVEEESWEMGMKKEVGARLIETQLCGSGSSLIIASRQHRGRTTSISYVCITINNNSKRTITDLLNIYLVP